MNQHINSLYHNGMKSTMIFTGAQPHIINKYKILKHKILKYNANIYFSIFIKRVTYAAVGIRDFTSRKKKKIAKRTYLAKP